jgi:hypothetical protein
MVQRIGFGRVGRKRSPDVEPILKASICPNLKGMIHEIFHFRIFTN